MGHDVDAIVCGVGSGGTIAGLSAYFRKVQPELGFVLADPKGSIVAEYTRSGKLGTAGSWAVEGIGEDFIPTIADLSSVCAAYEIPDEESFGTARELLRAEGILGGSSTGTLLAAALRFCREQKTPKRVVSFVVDTGTRYLSKVYNDQWMLDQGLLPRKRYWRPARRDLAPLRRRQRRQRRSRRHAADGVRAHARRRRLAAACARRQDAGRRDRRVRPAAQRACRRGALSLRGQHRDDRCAADFGAEREPRPSSKRCSTAGWSRSSPTATASTASSPASTC
jgi:hypothetical protein